ncbi:MAG: hypothetical protein OEV91_02455 [Desulfobulbaceae bacterium]|nr:hypothetical protein [Desulfobulbaceae bacterium]
MGSDIASVFRAAFAHIIKQAKRGTQARVSKETGLYGSQVGDLLSGRRPGSEEQRRSIATALGYTYEDMLSLGQWILDGKDPAEFKKTGQVHQAQAAIRLGANVTAGPEIIGGIPLISFVQAGGWSGIVDDFQPGDAEEWLPRMTGVGPSSFALRVTAFPPAKYTHGLLCLSPWK